MCIKLSNLQFVDDLLEAVEEWSLINCEKRFLAKGGEIFLPGQFEIEEGDVLYPICSGGVCRSQTLYLLLKELTKKKEVKLFSPHASRRGFDPYNGEVQIHREVVKNDEFEKTFHVKRCIQFGFEKREQWMAAGLNSEELRRYYDQHYFGKTEAKRRIYIAFASPVHVILKRLVEANEDLSQVWLVAIPLADEISNPTHEEIKMGSVEAYQAFLNKIRPMFV
jgi:hypothetical protein